MKRHCEFFENFSIIQYFTLNKIFETIYADHEKTVFNKKTEKNSPKKEQKQNDEKMRSLNLDKTSLYYTIYINDTIICFKYCTQYLKI